MNIGDRVRGSLPNGALVRGEIEEIRDGRVSIRDDQGKLWPVCEITVKAADDLPDAVVINKKAQANAAPFEPFFDKKSLTVSPKTDPRSDTPQIVTGEWTEHNETFKAAASRKLIDILQCPFCDGTADLDQKPHPSSQATTYFVRCGKCEVHGPWHKSPGNAVRLWNTRSTRLPSVPGSIDCEQTGTSNQVGR